MKKSRQWRMGRKAGIKSCQPTIRQLQVEIDFADTYCKICGSCGHDGCCPAERCAYPSIKAETVTEFKEMFDDVHKENVMLKAKIQELEKSCYDLTHR